MATKKLAQENAASKQKKVATATPTHMLAAPQASIHRPMRSPLYCPQLRALWPQILVAQALTILELQKMIEEMKAEIEWRQDLLNKRQTDRIEDKAEITRLLAELAEVKKQSLALASSALAPAPPAPPAPALAPVPARAPAEAVEVVNLHDVQQQVKHRRIAIMESLTEEKMLETAPKTGRPVVLDLLKEAASFEWDQLDRNVEDDHAFVGFVANFKNEGPVYVGGIELGKGSFGTVLSPIATLSFGRSTWRSASAFTLHFSTYCWQVHLALRLSDAPSIKLLQTAKNAYNNPNTSPPDRATFGVMIPQIVHEYVRPKFEHCLKRIRYGLL